MNTFCSEINFVLGIYYREYAEFIERRLKTVGLSVDLLFPNEEVPLGRVLGNIASRGTLYALVVTQLSEEHKSVTVNILYGQTQGKRLINVFAIFHSL